MSMTTAQLKTHIYTVQPIDSSELTDNIMTEIISKGLSTINKYYPFKKLVLVSAGTYTYEVGQKLLNAYLTYDNEVPDYSKPAKVVELGLDTGVIIGVQVYEPCFLVLACELTADGDTINISGNWELQFKTAAEILAKQYVANTRRIVGMSGTPFDLKGDQFFTEAKEEWDSFVTKLQGLESGF